MHIFILIVVITTNQGTTTISQEFNSERNCEIALKHIKASEKDRYSWPTLAHGGCYLK